MVNQKNKIGITLVETPDAQVSPLSGLYETFNSFGLLAKIEPGIPEKPFEVDIVIPDGYNKVMKSWKRSMIDEIYYPDIIIVPLMAVSDTGWEVGRYPEIVEWLCRMHNMGSVLCSACTGVLLLAETGLLKGKEATIHWAFADTFKDCFPEVKLRTSEVLITSGHQRELVMTGGVMSWHDLALYLISRYIGPMAALSMSRLLMLQWHSEGQSPYISFSPGIDHGDALIVRLQRWLQENYMCENPVETMAVESGIARRSFGRRFRKATGFPPIEYIQNLRIAEARKRLERTSEPVEEISFKVGYENTAFFRKVFKRTTRLSPAEYRRKFQVLKFSDKNN